MKISFLSNAPWALCGYGQIVKNIVPPINEKFPLCFIPNYGLQGGYKLENFWKGITFYGPGEGGFEESLVPNHVRDFGAECVITIFDIWAWSKLHLELKNNRIPLVPYVPIDAHDLNPRYKEILKDCFKIIPMSQHSEDCLKKHFPEKTLPHILPGIDLSIFKPLWETVEEKNKLKLKLGFTEDTFVITLMGDIKSWRKRWVENLEGVKIFRERNPNIKVGVYIQTNMRMSNALDFNIHALVQELGLQEITRTIDTYAYVKGISDEEMAKAYNASDVFLQASYGEGAGMMFLESAASGTPSIGTDFSSMRQTVKNGVSGYLVRPICISYDQSLAKKALPDPEDIANKLELIYRKGSHTFRDACVDFAKQFEWKKIIEEQWIPTLQKLEEDIAKAGFNPPSPGEELQKRSEKISVQ